MHYGDELHYSRCSLSVISVLRHSFNTHIIRIQIAVMSSWCIETITPDTANICITCFIRA